MDVSEKIYKLVSQVPKNKVTTYKQIAKALKIKNPRTVGHYLHRNLKPEVIPCHRVVKTNGTLATGYAFGGMKKQKELLEKEGIKFSQNNTIDLKKYLFSP